MNDAKAELPLNEYLAGQEKIKVLADGACQRILYGNYSRSYRSALDPIEDFRRARARENRAAWNHLFRGLVTERASLPLDSHFHTSNLDVRAWESKFFSNTNASRPLE